MHSTHAAARRATFVTPLLGIWLGLSMSFMPATGHAATETRTVGDFQAIALGVSLDLVVRQGPQQLLQLQGDEALLARLETVVESGSNGPALVVRWKKDNNTVYMRGKAVMTVVLPRLSALNVTGSGDVKIENFSTATLQLAMSGSGDIKLLGLVTEDLNVRISGSGDISGSGKANKLKISIAGSGNARLKELSADDVTVSIAGSGDAAVNAQKSLTVSIAGSGDVNYSGNPTVKKSVVGSGSVSQR